MKQVLNRSFRTPSLKNRLAFQFLAIFSFFSIAVVGVLIVHTVTMFRASQIVAEQEPVELLEEMAARLNTYLLAARDHLDLVALSLEEGDRPSEVALRSLELEVEPQFIGVFDTEGVLRWGRSYASTTPFLVGDAVTTQPFFINASRGRDYVGQPRRDDEGAHVVEWSRPVTWQATGGTSSEEVSEVSGVLYALIDLRPIVEVLSAQTEVSTYLVDANGKPLLLNEYAQNRQLTIGGSRGIVAAYLANRSGVFSFTTPEGERVIASWSPVLEAPWALVIEVPSRIVFQEVYTSLFLLLVLLAAVLCMLIYIVMFFNRMLLSPIDKLQKNIIAFAKGDMSARSSVESKNELGVLSETFNEMADRIANEPKRLQEEVKRRTEELAAANEKLQELVRQAHDNSKKILKKEHDLVEANEQLQRLNKEMDQVGKILVRRDRDLTEANQRLEEMDKVKSEFVSIAAHQLRTPLTAVKWSLKGLKDGEFGKLDETQQQAVDNGLKAAEGAIDLINDLLDTARIEGGRFGFHFEVGPLAPVVFDMLDRLKTRAEHKGITIVPPKIAHDVLLRRDPERLGMALENSVDNAIKYTEPGGTITVTVDATDEDIVITTKDTGIGIPEDQQHRLFDKFFRAPNAMLMQTSGTGLGLYLMRNIIEKHDGTVRIESKENEGTSVIYELPRVKK